MLFAMLFECLKLQTAQQLWFKTFGCGLTKDLMIRTTSILKSVAPHFSSVVYKNQAKLKSTTQ